jgi:aryl-alcohol dehydrogenase-like predicted oxidoreductase
MIRIPLGHTGLEVSRIGLGCMGMSSVYGDSDPDSCLETLAGALDSGVNFFDTADIYGWGANEQFLSQFLPGRRDQVVLATKCGITRGPTPLEQGRDTSPAYIRQACEASLKRLGTDVIDLYYLHRLDGVTPLEDSLGALADLIAEGKIRAAGLSEVSAATVRRAHALLPIAAIQNEYSLATRGGDSEPVIEACREIDAAFVPYSPISRGLLTGAYRDPSAFGKGDFRTVLPRFSEDALPANLRLVDAVAAIGARYEASPVQVALAWVLARAPHIAPIPGTRRLDRLKENVGAAELNLSSEDLAAIEAAVPTDAVAGARYPATLDKPLG